MAEDGKLWKAKPPGCGGTFDDYSVQGTKYESMDGEIAWHITTWKDDPPVRDYWVARGKFYGMSIHYWYTPVGDSHVEILDEIKVVGPKERKAVFDAIEAWRK